MYSIEYSQLADKQLSKLPIATQNRIVLSLERLRIRPHSFVKKLVGNEFYSFRIGDYRVILDIVENRLVIMVFEIGHRRNVYK